MRSLPTVLVLALTLALPELAAAAGYPPTSVRDDIGGDTLHYQPAGGNWDARLRLFQGSGDDDAPATMWLVELSLEGDAAPYNVAPDSSTLRLVAPAASAPWADGKSLVADPGSDTIWEIDPTSDEVTMTAFTTSGSDGAPLCSPVALATRTETAAEIVAWFAEGGRPGTDHPWGEYFLACSTDSGAGGIQQRSEGGDGQRIAPEGWHAYELPRRPAKGMAYTELWGQELFVVVGESPFGANYDIFGDSDRGRVLRLRFDGDDVWIDNWSILPDVVETPDGQPAAAELGQPRWIAPLSGKRLAIAGDKGIMITDVEGNFLDIAWASHDSAPEDLEDVQGVLGLASSPDGESLYALFDTGASGRKLALWPSSTFWEPAHDATVHVDPGMGGDSCEWLQQEPLEGRCPTIQEAVLRAPSGAEVLVPPGTYEEPISVLAKALTLRAEQPGSVRLIATDKPAVQVWYNGPPGLTIDGFVIEGGSGMDLPLPFPAGWSLGGSVGVIEGALTLTRTLVTGGTATYGGGMAALSPRGIHLEGVGFAGNVATWGGAFTIQGGWMHPTAPLEIGYVTIADNTATTMGGAMCLASTRVNATGLILADNGDTPMCYLESEYGSMEAGIAYSDLWPQDQWLVHPAGDGGIIDLAAEGGVLGAGILTEDPLLADPGALDLHLGEGSPCIDTADPAIYDADGTRSDMGMYGFVDWQEGDDDDDVGPDDDDDVGPDDDDLAVDDDDDDDDSADITELLPSGFRCDCSTASGGSAALIGLLLALVAVARRR